MKKFMEKVDFSRATAENADGTARFSGNLEKFPGILALTPGNLMKFPGISPQFPRKAAGFLGKLRDIPNRQKPFARISAEVPPIVASDVWILVKILRFFACRLGIELYNVW
jgi:hypothetical protein